MGFPATGQFKKKVNSFTQTNSLFFLMGQSLQHNTNPIPHLTSFKLDLKKKKKRQTIASLFINYLLDTANKTDNSITDRGVAQRLQQNEKQGGQMFGLGSPICKSAAQLFMGSRNKARTTPLNPLSFGNNVQLWTSSPLPSHKFGFLCTAQHADQGAAVRQRGSGLFFVQCSLFRSL